MLCVVNGRSQELFSATGELSRAAVAATGDDTDVQAISRRPEVKETGKKALFESAAVLKQFCLLLKTVVFHLTWSPGHPLPPELTLTSGDPCCLPVSGEKTARARGDV